jgi:hypothetical protein
MALPKGGDKSAPIPPGEAQAESFILGFHARVSAGPLGASLKAASAASVDRAETRFAAALAKQDGLSKEESDGIEAMRKGAKVDRGGDPRAWWVGWNFAEKGVVFCSGENGRNLLSAALGSFCSQAGIALEVGAEGMEQAVRDATGGFVDLDMDSAEIPADSENGFFSSLGL